MKTILQLHKPLFAAPRFRIVVSGTNSQVLKRIINEGSDQKIKQNVDSLLDDFSSPRETKKHQAIDALVKVVTDQEYIDERIIPALIREIKNPKFAKQALTALSSLVTLVSAYDRDLLEVFDNNLIEDRISPCAKGIRIIVGRENNRPGLVKKLCNLLPQSRDLESSVEILGALNTFLTVDCGMSQEDLAYIADLSQPKVFTRDQIVVVSGKSLRHDEYINNEVLIQMPELESLITITNNQIVINYTKLKSDAIAKIRERIKVDGQFNQSTVSVLNRSISTGAEILRINSIAAICAIASIPAGLNGQSFDLIRSAAVDKSLEIKENSIEGLLEIVGNSEVISKEAESIFIAQSTSNESEKIRICSFLGLAKILSSRQIENNTLSSLLIKAVGSDAASPLEKRAALIAVGSYLSWFDLSSNDFTPSILRRAVDRDEDVRSSAFEALAKKLEWGDIKEVDSMVLAGVNDHSPLVRAKAFKCVSKLMDFRANIADNLTNRVELSLYSKDGEEVAEALFLMGNIISNTAGASNITLDISNLFKLASKGDFQISRAATFCLATIATSRPKMLDTFQEDGIEVLCRIHGLCLPSDEDKYTKKICEAYQQLNKKYNQWRSQQLAGIASNPLASRTFLRSEAMEAGFGFVGNALHSANEQLVSAGKRIRTLSTQNLDLSIKLEKEREIRLQLESVLDQQCLQLARIAEADKPNQGNILSAKATLWFLERCLRLSIGQSVFTLADVISDIKYNVIRRLPKQVTSLVLSRPLQSTFEIQPENVRKVVDVIDFRDVKHWLYDMFD